MAPNFSRGTRRIFSTYRRALRTGITTGVLLSALLSAWLLIANRIGWFENYAGVRNVITGILAIAIAILPVVRFARWPRALLLSGVIGWFILGACYFAWTLYFEDLADRWSTPRMLMMGAITYLFVSALAWVANAMMAARAPHSQRADHPMENHHTLNHT